MDEEIYTKDELFEDDISIDNAYQMIKNKSSDKKLKKIKFLKNVYMIRPDTNNKIHIGWLLSPYHFIYRNDQNQLYFTYSLRFSRDLSNDIILNNNPRTDGTKIYSTLFNVSVGDAYSHDLVEYRTSHWLHKAGLDDFPLHISMTCGCDSNHCSYDDAEFYYNSSEDFYLHRLKDKSDLDSNESDSDSDKYKVPLVKVNVSVSFGDAHFSD